MRATGTLFLTADRAGIVDVTYHEHTPGGRPKLAGQRITIGPWRVVLSMFNPKPTTRVIVREACPHCGSPKPSDQSCICVDNGCE